MKPKSNFGVETAAAPLRLSTFLPYRLNVAAATVSEGLARIYNARFGIGVPEWRVLATIGEFGSMTGKAIGEHSHMNKVKVSRAVAALESRGLVARTTNAEDMREAFLQLTPQGVTMYREVVPLATAYVAELESALTRKELDQLDAMLAKLVERARAMSQNRG